MVKDVELPKGKIGLSSRPASVVLLSSSWSADGTYSTKQCRIISVSTLLWIRRLGELMTNIRNTRVIVIAAAIIALSGILSLLAGLE